jgi:hypothetical protein
MSKHAGFAQEMVLLAQEHYSVCSGAEWGNNIVLLHKRV